ncbi:MAG TPA: transporter [Pyrinomonadaceae bacterium]|nr:transporter [Pyrinomonadaceae bacterium]
MTSTRAKRERPGSPSGQPARGVGSLQPSPLLRTPLGVACALALFFLVSAAVQAQQPFVTDDADVTPKGRFHFEFSNEFDLLQRSSFPNLKQNTADFELDYGLFEGVEIGVAAPLLTIFNAAGTSPKTVTGIGDMNLSVKYNFREEKENSSVPALTLAFNFEVPTGDTERQLGSGLADFYINGILQKSLNKATKLRLNGGILFSGNAATGVLGIKSRGTVYTAGGSLVRQFTPKLQLGVELTGATTSEFQLGKGQLQTLIGGNYQVKDNLSFDFGIVGGKYDASPRVGAQLGVSLDF